MSTSEILAEIKRRVMAVDPTAQVVLYGSYARGDQGPESDIDLLILLDKESVSYEDDKHISYPLFDLEIETGHMISPRVLSKKEWLNRPFATPYFENVQREGRVL